MHRVIGFLLLSVVATVPATAEPSQKTIEFLREIGVDPESERIKGISSDVIQSQKGEIASVEELAKKRNKAALLRFISTRNFVKAYVRDVNTRLPATDDYDASYLTPEEKTFVQPAFRKAGDELYLQSLQQKKKQTP